MPSTSLGVESPVKDMGYHEYLADVGGYASILGLMISVWVLINLRRIRNQFLFQARFPALRKAIGSHSNTISELLNSFPSSASDIEVELERCSRNLKNLKGKVTGTTRQSVRILIKQINYMTKPFTEQSKADIRKVYVGLTGLETDLKNLTEDQKWRTE